MRPSRGRAARPWGATRARRPARAGRARPLSLSALRLVCDALSLATAMACIVVGVLHFAPSVREWVQSFIWWGLLNLRCEQHSDFF